MIFTKNIGSVDKILRIILGLGILSLAFVGPKTPFGYIGVVLIVTSFINFCPIYSIFKISSTKK